jgi:hypothetical protein
MAKRNQTTESTVTDFASILEGFNTADERYRKTLMYAAKEYVGYTLYQRAMRNDESFDWTKFRTDFVNEYESADNTVLEGILSKYAGFTERSQIVDYARQCAARYQRRSEQRMSA